MQSPSPSIWDAGRKISDEIKFFTATEEENKVIAQVSPEALRTGKLQGDLISARRKGDFALVNPDEIELMDVSPNQLVSIAASLTPRTEAAWRAASAPSRRAPTRSRACRPCRR